MYLSIENSVILDEIIKSFEVAYRSHVAAKIVDKYPNINTFSISVNKINDSFEKSSVILSAKLKGKVVKIKNEVGKYYVQLQDCNNSYKTKKYVAKDVLFVSELVDFVFLFYNDCFKDISRGFATVEEFKDYSSKYHLLRNSLSHPASSYILLQHAKEVITYIKRLLINVDDDKFWYVSKREILQKIDNFVDSIEQIPIKVHNLEDIAIRHHKVLCRDHELQILSDYIFGKDDSYRKSGSVVIYGYGGVGKTALVLEFIYNIIKRKFDNKACEMDFILFYSGKEEILSYSETTGKLYIDIINKQFDTFSNLNKKLFADLKIDNLNELIGRKGVVVIDNIETIADSEKNQIYEFIKKSPRTVQYLITSRNEEPCEDKLNLKEFKDKDIGKKFINEFIETNNLDLYLTDKQKDELVLLSKGNALIIVISLILLKSGSSFNEISSDLSNVEASNLNVIADFMYKNTINQSISQLEEEGYKPTQILKVISLYGVPIDLYSLSFLSNFEIIEVEHICNFLTSKLILEKSNESFSINEFAYKFILLKFLPDKIERRGLIEKILQYQDRLNSQLEKLETIKQREVRLEALMEDWKPKNAIDKIAIAETFNLYGYAKEAIEKNDEARLDRIRKDFERNEKMTSHPYIKYQKARTYELFLSFYFNKKLINEIKNIISNSFENAIESIDFYYPFIRGTKSYGSLNGFYGLFILIKLNDPIKALRFFEEAIDVLKKLSIKDKVYFTILSGLSNSYIKAYKIKSDIRYFNEFKKIYDDFSSSKEDVIKADYDYGNYIRKFSPFIIEKKAKTRNNLKIVLKFKAQQNNDLLSPLK